MLKEKEILLFDAAMGSRLIEKGILLGEHPEKILFHNPEVIAQLHYEDLCAGSQVISTHTFGLNGRKYKGEENCIQPLLGLAVEQAIKAKNKYLNQHPQKDIKIALDIGPLGGLMKPMGDLSFDEAYAFYESLATQVNGLEFDCVLLETHTQLLEAKCAILAIQSVLNQPIICTMSFEKEGRTFSGTDVESMATVLEGLGVYALGINCSLGPEDMISFVERLRASTALPLLVQPNAGVPLEKDGMVTYTYSDEGFADAMEKIVDLGVQMIGGCCGTTSQTIAKLKQRLAKNISGSSVSSYQPQTRIASYGQRLVIGQKPLVVGERINPTGKKHLQQSLRDEQWHDILSEAIKQIEEGADILDINVGMPGIDEKKVMKRIIEEIQALSPIPLQIDSSSAEVIEVALKYYNGKAIVNSVDGREENLKSILPLVSRYGACVVALTIDEKGVPHNAKERLRIAKKILERAAFYGIPKENVIFDCLTLTASAEQEAVEETLSALESVKKDMGCCTTLGVSNVSFGLPHRIAVHQTFLTMALERGLDLPIINPGQKPMMDTLRAYNLLKGYDLRGQDYILKMTDQPKDTAVRENCLNHPLRHWIVKGLEKEALEALQALMKCKKPMAIIEEEMIPALNDVGEQFEKGEIFLPQLIQSARVVQVIFKPLKKVFYQEGGENFYKGKIILATVQYDVHDIGKNIVKLILENYGYQIIDLGKDVPAEAVCEAIAKHQVTLVGLSALMTSTVESMKKTVEKIHGEFPHCKVVVGGAVLNEDYAKKMQADFYAKDPKELVSIASKHFSN